MNRYFAFALTAVAFSTTSAFADCRDLAGAWAGIVTNPATGGTRPITISIASIQPTCQANVTYSWGPHSILGGPPGSRSFTLKVAENGFTIPLTEFRAQAIVRVRGKQVNVRWSDKRGTTAVGNLSRN